MNGEELKQLKRIEKFNRTKLEMLAQGFNQKYDAYVDLEDEESFDSFKNEISILYEAISMYEESHDNVQSFLEQCTGNGNKK